MAAPLASFSPGCLILGRGGGELARALPFVAVALSLVAHQAWRFGPRHSTGTGT